MSDILDGMWIAKPNHWSVGSSKSGAVEVAINFELEAHVDPKTKTETPPAQPLFITGYFYPITKEKKVNENALQSLKQSFGWNGRSFAELSKMDLASKRVKVVVGHEPDLKNRMRARVQYLNPIDYDGPTFKETDQKFVSDLDATMGGLLAAHASTEPAADAPTAYVPPTEAAPTPAPVDAPAIQSNDIPF